MLCFGKRKPKEEKPKAAEERPKSIRKDSESKTKNENNISTSQHPETKHTDESASQPNTENDVTSRDVQESPASKEKEKGGKGSRKEDTSNKKSIKPEKKIVEIVQKAKQTNKNLTGVALLSLTDESNPKLIYPKKLKDEKLHENLVSVFLRLIKSSHSLAETLYEDKCNFIHIQGENNLFSYTEVADNYALIFYSSIENDEQRYKSFEIFDELEDLIEELGELLEENSL